MRVEPIVMLVAGIGEGGGRGGVEVEEGVALNVFICPFSFFFIMQGTSRSPIQQST